MRLFVAGSQTGIHLVVLEDKNSLSMKLGVSVGKATGSCDMRTVEPVEAVPAVVREILNEDMPKGYKGSALPKIFEMM
jgi:hypothetical protein